MGAYYCLLWLLLAPAPLYLWLPYLSSVTSALLSSLLLPSPPSSYQYIVVGSGRTVLLLMLFIQGV